MAVPHDLHCPTNPGAPQVVGICDRCGCKYYLADLAFQFDWRGNHLANLRIRVCPECYDTPNEQYRPIMITPDPAPVKDPRPYFYQYQSQGGTTPPTSQELVNYFIGNAVNWSPP